MNDGQSLTALSPLDGRYASQTEPLRQYFSEFALIKYRAFIELRYLEMLSRHGVIRSFTSHEKNILKNIAAGFSLPDAREIKTYEKETKHDVKALEYFLKRKLKGTTLMDILPYIHFGLTSEDVNNLAYGVMLSGANSSVLQPQLTTVLSAVRHLSSAHSGHALLALTHGQPAVPTTFGKEIAVYYRRLAHAAAEISSHQFEGKLTGAVGNYNAVVFAFPKKNWLRISSDFVSSLGLIPNYVTTQILPADNFVEYCQHVNLLNTILIGLCQDMWAYIGRGLVRQMRAAGQVGSSTMPQKINPIDFENAEGNLLIADNYFELYARKLPVSRMQRDLSDSTVKRTMGSALGHTLLAWKSIERGLASISFDREAARTELDGHWEVLAEAMQIYFKMHGDEKGYEKVKKQLMGKHIDRNMYEHLTRGFPPLAELTPATYSGLAKKLTELALKTK